LFLLSEGQMARISPHFPLSHGVPRVDNRCVVRAQPPPAQQVVPGCRSVAVYEGDYGDD
jgi:hypothetical protein